MLYLPILIEGSGLSKAIKALRLFQALGTSFTLVFENSVFQIQFFLTKQRITLFLEYMCVCV